MKQAGRQTNGQVGRKLGVRAQKTSKLANKETTGKKKGRQVNTQKTHKQAKTRKSGKQTSKHK